MKTFVAVAAALALALPTFAQDITSLPQCAQQPILEAISASGCPLTDITCICGNENFVNGLLELIPTLCTADEVAVVTEFAETLCVAYGVTLSLPDVQSTSPSTASANPTATGASVTSAVPTTATTQSASQTSASSSAAPASSSEAASSTAASESSASASAEVSQSTGAAVINSASAQAMLGAAALVVAAVL